MRWWTSGNGSPATWTARHPAEPATPSPHARRGKTCNAGQYAASSRRGTPPVTGRNRPVTARGPSVATVGPMAGVAGAGGRDIPPRPNGSQPCRRHGGHGGQGQPSDLRNGPGRAGALHAHVGDAHYGSRPGTVVGQPAQY